ncbi:protein GVQW3 [Trichonephila clavipes]|nr:protein GVQW3 [Trichonephila clavipes]
MIKTALGDETMSRAWVFDWFRRFKESRQSVNSDPRSGRPSTSRNEDKIAQVKAVVRSDRRLTVREIAQECHISVGSCDEILRKDVNMRRVFAPHLLTEDQQFQRLTTSSAFFKVRATIRSSRSSSSLGMSRGFTDTIPKQSSSCHNGKPPVLLGQRKHGRCDQSHVDCVFRCRWNCSS